MQDLPLHRLSAGSLVQLVDEVPCGHVGPVAGFDDLGLALGRRSIEGRRDIHAVDDSSHRPRGAVVATLNPQLVTRLEASSVMLCSDRPDRGCTGRSKARPGLLTSWAGLRLLAGALMSRARPVGALADPDL